MRESREQVIAGIREHAVYARDAGIEVAWMQHLIDAIDKNEFYFGFQWLRAIRIADRAWYRR